jgi:hypothetical protein
VRWSSAISCSSTRSDSLVAARDAREVVRVAVRAARMAPEALQPAVGCSLPEQSLVACLASASYDSSRWPALRACKACRLEVITHHGHLLLHVLLRLGRLLGEVARERVLQLAKDERPRMSGPALESGDIGTRRADDARVERGIRGAALASPRASRCSRARATRCPSARAYRTAPRRLV